LVPTLVLQLWTPTITTERILTMGEDGTRILKGAEPAKKSKKKAAKKKVAPKKAAKKKAAKKK
jgi:hypothetical protein